MSRPDVAIFKFWCPKECKMSVFWMRPNKSDAKPTRGLGMINLKNPTNLASLLVRISSPTFWKHELTCSSTDLPTPDLPTYYAVLATLTSSVTLSQFERNGKIWLVSKPSGSNIVVLDQASVYLIWILISNVGWLKFQLKLWATRLFSHRIRSRLQILIWDWPRRDATAAIYRTTNPL